MDYYTKIYQNITYQVVHEVNIASLNTNFTIVIQPMFAMADISNFTIDFLSTLDCFHPSLTAHQAMSISLWNNLFLHPMKKEAFVQYPVLKCLPMTLFIGMLLIIRKVIKIKYLIKYMCYK